jgi:GNAT superfamily N-acetyltransferase
MNMENQVVNIREMLKSDMEGLMRLKDAEGWNQTPGDWELLIGYKDSVNLVSEVDNKIVGSITAINYSDTVAWIGMMLVDKEYRGRGISKLLLNETIGKLEGCNSIKLDATPAGRPVYKKIGFLDELTLFRMTNPSVVKLMPGDFGKEAEPVTPERIPDIIEFDKAVFGASRKELMMSLYNNSPELAWVIYEDNAVSGFCLGRAGTRFKQIGPVYASTEEGAKTLIGSALRSIEGEACAVDIHGDKPEMEEWLTQAGFTTQRPFDRMYLNENPHPGRVKMQYLISGPELG